MDKIELVDVARLSLNQGDTLIVRVERELSKDLNDRVVAHFHGIFPENKIVVLAPGMSLEVVERKDT